MAVRHQLIRTPPESVWAVLADGSRYQDWVVGTDHSRPLDDTWPQVGSAIAYTARLGPWKLDSHTVVRRCVPTRELELEVDSGRLGTVRVALELRPWGAHTLVLVDEHPLGGPAGRLHNTVLDVFLQLRHRDMLSRLAEATENDGAGENDGAAGGDTAVKSAGEK
ncbi:SRPBCC family protein [Streptomyces sioyaensis]|uniref:SRPBCC family protein n=1 Tax=Streptomyces sioyaensis TaxID=67364 RepID=UPI0037BAC8BB